MFNSLRYFWIFCGSAIMILSILACNLGVASLPEPSPSALTGAATQIVLPAPTISAVPSATLTDTPPSPSATIPSTLMFLGSPTASAVTITVSGGNLNVRRGPGQAYDPLAALLDGQTAAASARNEDGSWIYISVPSLPGRSGWVSTKTKYSSTKGDISSLPLLTVAPAVPAYIRNCTFHDMLVKPAGTVLPPQTAAPDNKMQFNPGDYEVYDQTTSSLVASFTLLEGKKIDIKKDGLGNSYSCP